MRTRSTFVVIAGRGIGFGFRPQHPDR